MSFIGLGANRPYQQNGTVKLWMPASSGKSVKAVCQRQGKAGLAACGGRGSKAGEGIPRAPSLFLRVFWVWLMLSRLF